MTAPTRQSRSDRGCTNLAISDCHLYVYVLAGRECPTLYPTPSGAPLFRVPPVASRRSDRPVSNEPQARRAAPGPADHLSQRSLRPRCPPRPAGERRSRVRRQDRDAGRSPQRADQRLDPPRRTPGHARTGIATPVRTSARCVAANRHSIRGWPWSRNRVGLAEMRNSPGGQERRSGRRGLTRGRRGRLGVATARGGSAADAARQRADEQAEDDQGQERWVCLAGAGAGREGLNAAEVATAGRARSSSCGGWRAVPSRSDMRARGPRPLGVGLRYGQGTSLAGSDWPRPGWARAGLSGMPIGRRTECSLRRTPQ